MDNFSARKGERVRKLWVRKLYEHRGCELLYLPPYSLDLSPIEEAFRGGQAHPQEAQRSRQGGTDRGYRSSIGNRKYRRREGVLL
jgi:hypothetical protein